VLALLLLTTTQRADSAEEKKKTNIARLIANSSLCFLAFSRVRRRRERENNIRRTMGSSPPQSESPSPPQSERGSRSYTPALLDMFNNNSNGGGGGGVGESGETPKSGGSKNDGENNNTFSSSGSRPNSDSKPPRHASFNFQIQSKNNNSINGESPLQPLPLIKDQLQVVEVTRNGRARKVSMLSRSGFLFSLLGVILLFK
jgi:hypothetical protein